MWEMQSKVTRYDPRQKRQVTVLYYWNEYSKGRTVVTSYHGRQFRSVQAARWSVFLDVLGIAYDYQERSWPPLFNLPQLGFQMSVLGRKPTPGEERLTTGQASKRTTYLFMEEIGVPRQYKSHEWYPPAGAYFPEGYDEYYTWCECPSCGAFGITFSGWAERLRCGCPHNGKKPNFASPHLLGAYLTALRMQFVQEEPPRFVPPTPPPAALHFAIGDIVKHHLFGDGIVLKSYFQQQEELVEVEFDLPTGIKTLAVAFARLEKIG